MEEGGGTDMEMLRQIYGWLKDGLVWAGVVGVDLLR